MKLNNSIFQISQLSKESIRFIKVTDKKIKKDIIKNSIENLLEGKTILILIGNDYIETIRNDISLFEYSAGIITERILNECKKNNIDYSISLAFNEKNIREIIKLPMFMKIVSLISINSDVDIQQNFVYENIWQPRD